MSEELGRDGGEAVWSAGTDRAEASGADLAAYDGTASTISQPTDTTQSRPDQPGRQGTGPPARPQWRHSPWIEVGVLIVTAVILTALIKTYVTQIFFIPSGSMENTLHIGDRVLVNKLVYHFRSIEPGDIVVFNGDGSWDPALSPQKVSSNPFLHAYDDTLRPVVNAVESVIGAGPEQIDYIKRVIGVPGDHVACCNARGLVTVNGVALHESSYLYPGSRPSQTPFSVTVPRGRLWVMGDNRAISYDSRGHVVDPGGGTVPEGEVIGRAFAVIWPPSHWRILQIPATFSQPGIAGRGHADAARPELAALAALARGVRVSPSAPYLPAAAGLAGAVPVTWLQLRVRRRLGRRRARRRTGCW